MFSVFMSFSEAEVQKFMNLSIYTDNATAPLIGAKAGRKAGEKVKVLIRTEAEMGPYMSKIGVLLIYFSSESTSVEICVPFLAGSSCLRFEFIVSF